MYSCEKCGKDVEFDLIKFLDQQSCEWTCPHCGVKYYVWLDGEDDEGYEQYRLELL